MAQAPSELTPQASALHFFGAELRRLRMTRRLSQEQLGRRVHVSGHLIGKIEKATRWPTLELARSIDQVLETGDELVRLWPQVERYRDSLRTAPWSPTGPTSTVGPDAALDRSGYGELSESVRRRYLGSLVGALTVGAVFDTAAPGISRLVSQLTPHLSGTEPELSEPIWTLSDARTAVAQSKRDYQAGQYSAVFDQLPEMLVSLRTLAETRADDEIAVAWRLVADAYHVAGSVLLKMDDVGMAMLAADRSMAAAQRSGDPIAIATSARIVTHALISGGHPDQGRRIAIEHATRLLSQGPRGQEAACAAGALVLRGAIAATRCGDHDAAHDLLDEAAGTAHRVPEGGNSRWTAFDATNVHLHRIHVALLLGDPGKTVALARQVDQSKVKLAERRACLHLDLAQAHAQQRRWDHAVAALHDAAHTAPQEVRNRPAAQRLIRHVYQAGPRTIRSRIRELATTAMMPT